MKKKHSGARKYFISAVILLLIAVVLATLLHNDGYNYRIKRVKLELMRTQLPEEVVALGRKNQDALDYALGWRKGRAKEYRAEEIDISDAVSAGSPTLLLQWDPRWGYADYGTSVMGISGCGPTCLSMVTAALCGNTEVNPLIVAQMADARGWYVPGVGTAWTLMTDGAAQLGLNAEQITTDRETILRTLDEGKLLIASMGPGDFTDAGHFIVISGYEDEGFHVLDPNSPTRSDMLWGYSKIHDQFAAIWAYS